MGQLINLMMERSSREILPKVIPNQGIFPSNTYLNERIFRYKRYKNVRHIPVLLIMDVHPQGFRAIFIPSSRMCVLWSSFYSLQFLQHNRGLLHLQCTRSVPSILRFTSSCSVILILKLRKLEILINYILLKEI